MTHMGYYIGIVIVIIILCSYQIYALAISRISNQMMTGFWEADKSFCNESGLSMFSIYMGDQDYSGVRPCYVLAIQDDDTIILNEPTTITISKPWSGILSQNLDPIEYNVSFADIKSEFFPRDQQMSYYVTSNKITLYKKDTVFAVLYKNPVLSEINKIKDSTNKTDDSTNKTDDILCSKEDEKLD
jgi:hypothetical protein